MQLSTVLLLRAVNDVNPLQQPMQSPHLSTKTKTMRRDSSDKLMDLSLRVSVKSTTADEARVPILASVSLDELDDIH